MLPVTAAVVMIGGRLLPHSPNFTPVLAVALWLGARSGGRVAIGTVIAAMLATDMMLGFHPLMPAVYAAILASVAIGRGIIGQSVGASRVVAIAGSVGVAAVAFFIITNAACWALWYPRTFDGLVTCYVNALPFFRATVLSTAVCAGGLFAASAVIAYASGCEARSLRSRNHYRTARLSVRL